jgi:hypothetical protein
MVTTANIWKNDKGFMWMLAISVVSLVSTQITIGLIWESKFIVRLGFFLFTIFAIRSSSLPSIGKVVGYFIASSLLLLAVVLIWFETASLILFYSALATGYMIYIITLVVNQIFTGGEITVYKIGGSVAVYILLGQLWASLYLTVHILDPASFLYGGEVIKNGDALKQLSYFSFVTLTTVGYGDIVAVNSVARLLVMMEGLLGQLFPAIFIAKLVSLQISNPTKPSN